jgi:hypothetical protein
VALPTLLDRDDREGIARRLRAVRPDAAAAWGRLTAPLMLCHLADQMRVAVGDVPAKPTHTFLMRTLVKSLVVNTAMKPPRGRAMTAPEMLASKPTTWEADIAAIIDLMERVGKGTSNAVHPAFGPLTPEQWGRLCWKHMDHHLTQFGA